MCIEDTLLDWSSPTLVYDGSQNPSIWKFPTDQNVRSMKFEFLALFNTSSEQISQSWDLGPGIFLVRRGFFFFLKQVLIGISFPSPICLLIDLSKAREFSFHPQLAFSLLFPRREFSTRGEKTSATEVAVPKGDLEKGLFSFQALVSSIRKKVPSDEINQEAASPDTISCPWEKLCPTPTLAYFLANRLHIIFQVCIWRLDFHAWLL